VAGSGIQSGEAGIKVTVGVLEERPFHQLNHGLIFTFLAKRPFILVGRVQDGLLRSSSLKAEKNQFGLLNQYSRQLVHKRRATILVGTQTADE
jgi:hypothetical protein